MAADSKNIIAATIPASGAAISIAPLGTTVPTDATTALDNKFTDLGWIGEDGVTNSVKREVTKHHAWSGEVVKVTQDRYTETFSFAMMESSAGVLKTVFGDDNVSETGGVITIKHTSDQLPRQVVVIDYRDGDTVGRFIVHECQITDIADIKYVHDSPTTFDITLDVFKPANGGEHVTQMVKFPAAAAAEGKSAPATAPATGGTPAR